MEFELSINFLFFYFFTFFLSNFLLYLLYLRPSALFHFIYIRGVGQPTGGGVAVVMTTTRATKTTITPITINSFYFYQFEHKNKLKNYSANCEDAIESLQNNAHSCILNNFLTKKKTKQQTITQRNSQ